MAKIKLTKVAVAAIVSVACAAFIISALLILNIFWPLKYLTAYLVSGGRPQEGRLEMCVLDVGTSDCTIVCLPNGKTMLIDGGDGTYRNNLKILTELNRRDIDYIDYVVCTTVTDDYCGGLGEILRQKQAGAVFYPYCINSYISEGFEDFISAAGDSGARMVVAEYGAGVAAEDFFFTFLSPALHTGPGSEYAALNADPSAANIAAASAVLWIEYEGSGILYAGGVSGQKLEEIADTYALMQALGDPDGYFTFAGNDIRLTSCAAYHVASHGGDIALATSFTDLIDPEYSVISAGEQSGVPSLEVLADLLHDAVPGVDDGIYITRYDGDVTVVIDESGVTCGGSA